LYVYGKPILPYMTVDVFLCFVGVSCVCVFVFLGGYVAYLFSRLQEKHHVFIIEENIKTLLVVLYIEHLNVFDNCLNKSLTYCL